MLNTNFHTQCHNNQWHNWDDLLCLIKTMWSKQLIVVTSWLQCDLLRCERWCVGKKPWLWCFQQGFNQQKSMTTLLQKPVNMPLQPSWLTPTLCIWNQLGTLPLLRCMRWWDDKKQNRVTRRNSVPQSQQAEHICPCIHLFKWIQWFTLPHLLI